VHRILLATAFALSASLCSAQTTLDVTGQSIENLQAAMAAGHLTSRRLVDAYLARIDAYDQRGPRLNAIVALNPRARDEADALDRERASRGARGPLHGIPILVKDNYDVAGLPTTAGTLALATLTATRDAFQVRRLREAGAVILGKTTMHELASGITNISSLTGQFTLDPLTNTLGYSIGPLRRDDGHGLLAVPLQRGEADKPGPILAHLVMPGTNGGATPGTGQITLRPRDRRDLDAGRVYVHVYTTGAPLGAGRAPLVPR
jgi:hypothetical protein